MPVRIARPQSGARVFPPVGGGGEDLAARRLTELSLTPLGTFKRMGWGLGSAERVSRLFVLRRLAMEAEAAKRINRADLFWTELRSRLAALPANDQLRNREDFREFPQSLNNERKQATARPRALDKTTLFQFFRRFR